MKISKKTYFTPLISILFCLCLSACNTQTKNDTQLVKYYGQDKVNEMKVKCTDQKQLDVANALIEKAKQVMSYTDSTKNTHIQHLGALEKYYFFKSDEYQTMASANVEINLITTKQENDKGYIWAKYSCYYYDENNQLIAGSDDIITRWDIALENSVWIVKNIDEMS